MEKKGQVFTKELDTDWTECVAALLDASGVAETLKEQTRILVKPNLVEALPPPITTPVELIEATVIYLRQNAPDSEIVVGDGTGSLNYDTYHAFEKLGYSEMAKRQGLKLTDLNKEPYVELSRPELKRWPKMHLPKIVMESYLLSIPVLKAHSLAGVTLTMKNMMGACPPEHYCKGGHWKKSSFHTGMQEAVLDLNRYRTPDFTLLDATVGLAEYHLGGSVCDPPPNLLVAGFDPVATDAYGAKLLGQDWKAIGHIAGANGELGSAEPLRVVQV